MSSECFSDRRSVLTSIDLPDRDKVSSGKVREMFADGPDHLLMVATDRISAFDVIMREGIPDKGTTLTALSKFWFRKTRHIVPNHWPESSEGSTEALLPDELKERTLRVIRAKPLPIECIVRGYLAGSGWKEYRERGTLAGEVLPRGLRESEQLPRALFTPSTKAATGHDENITRATAAQMLGKDLYERVEYISLRLYEFARSYAAERGIILADTKFEFGLRDGQLLLIDEALTPDSSRYWPAESYKPGCAQPSFDKQFLRDYLESLDWNKSPPPPPLPSHIIEGTRQRYLEALRRLTTE